MNRTGDKRGVGAGVAMLLIAGLLILLMTPFLPLLLALIESATFGTRRVEEFCMAIGIHELLSALYEPIINFVMNVL